MDDKHESINIQHQKGEKSPKDVCKPQHDCAQNFLVLAVLSQVSSLHPRLALETVTLPLEVGLDQAPPPATALDTPLAAGKLPGQTHPR